jgi:hypothetical protein
MHDAPYEPWKPALGDRVRVVPSPECRVNHHVLHGTVGRVTDISWDPQKDGPDLGYSAEDEAFDLASDDPPDAATIEQVKGYRFHWYAVTFDTLVSYDDPYGKKRRLLREDLFAAIELEREND